MRVRHWRWRARRRAAPDEEAEGRLPSWRTSNPMAHESSSRTSDVSLTPWGVRITGRWSRPSRAARQSSAWRSDRRRRWRLTRSGWIAAAETLGLLRSRYSGIAAVRAGRAELCAGHRDVAEPGRLQERQQPRPGRLGCSVSSVASARGPGFTSLARRGIPAIRHGVAGCRCRPAGWRARSLLGNPHGA